MLIGTTIRKMGAAEFFSPEFPRGGLAAVFSMDVTGEIGASTMNVDIEHRNLDETTWAGAGAFTAVTATGVSTVNITGLKEILRFKFSFGAGSDGDGFHVVLGPPAWRPFA
jgi:hypothetical protein